MNSHAILAALSRPDETHMTGSRRAVVYAVFLLVCAPSIAVSQRSVRIETLPWTEAERLLDTATVVMIPLGAQSKEHGPHLPLDNDFLLAEDFTTRVMAATT